MLRGEDEPGEQQEDTGDQREDGGFVDGVEGCDEGGRIEPLFNGTRETASCIKEGVVATEAAVDVWT